VESDTFLQGHRELLIQGGYSGTYLLDPPHLSAFQAHLDPVGVSGRTGQDVFYYPFGESTRPLILLENYGDLHPRSDICPPCSIHATLPLGVPRRRRVYSVFVFISGRLLSA
jgi:hypothetical protein